MDSHSFKDLHVDLSVVVSVLDEEEGLQKLYENIVSSLEPIGIGFQVIFVNDGSSDGSGNLIDELCRIDSRVVGVHFSRNFGHEAAMLAGIDFSNANAVICMDADLQHPPEMLPVMYELFLSGTEIVNMVRKDNEDNKGIKRWLSKSFYNLLNKMSPVHFVENASDFFLISGRVANILKRDFRERNRFLRGFIQILGFRKGTLEYHAKGRQFGKSKYSFMSLLKLSFNAIVSFSKIPLHLGITAGVIFALFSLVIGVYSLVMWSLGTTPPGYTTLVVLVSFAFSVQFFLIGFIGIYIGNNFEETKKRPLYIIDRTTNSNNEISSDNEL